MEFNIPKSSSIKAILERDDFPNKHMVLYVSKVNIGK